MLAFSGRFDAKALQEAVYREPSDDAAEQYASAFKSVQRSRNFQLHHRKAEAKARFNEGEWLHRHWELLRRDGEEWKLTKLTQRQRDLLDKWDNGQLLDERNDAILDLGHGCLQNAQGHKLHIGGSTGGGCRRIVDKWLPTDPYDVLECAQ